MSIQRWRRRSGLSSTTCSQPSRRLLLPLPQRLAGQPRSPRPRVLPSSAAPQCPCSDRHQEITDMYLLKKTPRAHGPNEPFRHENHPRPVTRRQLLGAGFLSGPAMVLAPAWIGGLLKSRTASALDATIASFEAECKIVDSGGGGAA